MTKLFTVKLVETAIASIEDQLVNASSQEERLFIAGNKAKELVSQISLQHRNDLSNLLDNIASIDDGCVSYTYDEQTIILNIDELGIMGMIALDEKFADFFDIWAIEMTPWEEVEDNSSSWFQEQLFDCLSADETCFYLMKLTVRTEMTEETVFGIVGLEPNSQNEFNDPDKALAAYAQSYYGGNYNADEEAFDHLGILCFPLDTQEITSDEVRFMQQKLSTRTFHSIEELQFNKNEVYQYIER